MSDVFMFRAQEKPAGAFRFARLNLTAHHRPIETFAMIAARTKAGERVGQIEDGIPAMALVGIETDGLASELGRAGLLNFCYVAELWIAVVTSVTIGDETATMPAEQVYAALAGDTALFMAWEQHSNTALASASEGNGFALSPEINGAGALNDAGTAVH